MEFQMMLSRWLPRFAFLVGHSNKNAALITDHRHMWREPTKMGANLVVLFCKCWITDQPWKIRVIKSVANKSYFINFKKFLTLLRSFCCIFNLDVQPEIQVLKVIFMLLKLQSYNSFWRLIFIFQDKSIKRNKKKSSKRISTHWSNAILHASLLFAAPSME